MVTKAPATWRAPSATRWEAGYANRLLATDVGVIAGAVSLAQMIRFDNSPLRAFGPGLMTRHSVVLGLLWLLALSVFQSRSRQVLGSGVDQYRRVLSATFWTFGVVALLALLLGLEPSRGYLAVALPVGTAGLLATRWLWRRHLTRRRARGQCRTPVVVIGDHDTVVTLVTELIGKGDHNFQVVGVGIYDQHRPGDWLQIDGVPIPILGDEREALAAVPSCGANTVALTGTERFGSRGVRNLLWELESRDIDLIVSPTSRLMMRPVPGYPLLRVERPQYREAKRFHKRLFDVAFAAAALTLASPLLIISALAIKLTSQGPVFYTAERVGLDGEPFRMYKFRTMVDGADALLPGLVGRNESPTGMLFKIRDDPRVTPVGKILRRFSIDEIPQFLNVLKGDMSVVGPRPPLQREVANYDGEVMRRMLVRPGVTGLWQVSGRSDLSWEDSVRLDLSYVENWSMGTDLVVILKTVRAVLARDGAY